LTTFGISTAHLVDDQSLIYHFAKTHLNEFIQLKELHILSDEDTEDADQSIILYDSIFDSCLNLKAIHPNNNLNLNNKDDIKETLTGIHLSKKAIET
jgi:hypothetical protein